MISKVAFDLNAIVAKRISSTFINYTAEIHSDWPNSNNRISYAIHEKGTFMYPLTTDPDDSTAAICNFNSLSIQVESYKEADWIWFYCNNGDFDASFDLRNAVETACAETILEFLINEFQTECTPNLNAHYAAFNN